MDAAQAVRIGRTDVAVTRFGLGCAPLAGLYAAVSDEQARATVDRAWELGVRYFDTAPLYGSGLSEQRVGAALQGRPRDAFVLSTKVGRLLAGGGGADSLFEGAPDATPVFDFSYDGALRSLEASLGRLGLDRVDVALIHDPDDHYEEAVEGAYRALLRLRDEGVVRAIGVGMNQSELLARFARETDVDCFLVAGRYTLLDRGALEELLPLCVERGIAVIAGGVFNSGILASDDGSGHFDYHDATPAQRDRVRRLAATCARWDVPLQAAALQFPLGHPAVASVLVGCRSAYEVSEDVRLLERELPPGLWEELLPGAEGPSRQAPRGQVRDHDLPPGLPPA
ncbi:MAG: D-threo-aldose 1-dehydrogenase [Gaiellaceae bacterium]|nr:D-threo-aldose 1-dehydrogenase [Gaiellaceae bacterium]